MNYIKYVRNLLMILLAVIIVSPIINYTKDTEYTKAYDFENCKAGIAREIEIPDITEEEKMYLAIEDNEELNVSASIEDSSSELLTEEEVEEYLNDNSKTYPVTNLDTNFNGYVTMYSDLSNCRMEITASQMNEIICSFGVDESSELYNTGQAFIDASRATGYDPIFLLALAANESGWNVSSLHASKNNPYSINMTDANPNGGYVLGETFDDGIVNGAIWISDNYYNNGYTTLYDMIYGGRQYASAADSWINVILNIMNKSYNVIL